MNLDIYPIFLSNNKRPSKKKEFTKKDKTSNVDRLMST